MTFTVGQAFDLLFDASSKPIDADSPDGATYESRRWFRRTLPVEKMTDLPTVEGGELPDVMKADERLRSKVAALLPVWHEKSELPAMADDHLFDIARHLPPRMPYDVFAFAAFIVETAGIYHHIQSSKTSSGGSGSPRSPRHIDISHEDRETVRKAAEAWANLPPIDDSMDAFATILTSEAIWEAIEPLFESWWIVAGASASAEVFDQGGAEVAVPLWWKHAWRLFAIADEAAKGTAFNFDVEELLAALGGTMGRIRWFELDVFSEHALRAPTHSGRGGRVHEFADLTTLSVARQTIANVLPKVRTPAVGCTLRSLSHHLALLPAAGIARGRWTPNYTRSPRHAGSMPDGVMNLLLVPMPYSIEARWFKPTTVEDATGSSAGLPGERQEPRFGYFDIDQSWLHGPARREKIVTFVQALIETTHLQSSAIHGIVFPELALDYETFSAVREHIRKQLPEADLLIGGVSSDRTSRCGNFVAVASFQEKGGGEREYREAVREKHHRWKLERAQLKDYGLLGVLSPELAWWENIELHSRKVDFTVMRRESVFAAMICEDLARVDPCQQVIRAVGPNLVVALLMDAPQLAQRWPARYATVLAEDPGCAVLTLTSRALMTRQHRLGIHRSNGDDRVVGMWRDDRNEQPMALKCPYDAQAILLTIVEERVEDISLDGRSDKAAKAWRYAGHAPIRVPKAKAEFAAILGEDDLCCW